MELEDLFFIEQLNNGFEIECLDAEQFKNLFEIDDKELNHHILQTANRCKDEGIKTTFTENLIYRGKNLDSLSIIAIYLITKHRFKKKAAELIFFKELAFETLLKYQGFSFRKLNKKKKIVNPSYDFEKQILNFKATFRFLFLPQTNL